MQRSFVKKQMKAPEEAPLQAEVEVENSIQDAAVFLEKFYSANAAFFDQNSFVEENIKIILHDKYHEDFFKLNEIARELIYKCLSIPPVINRLANAVSSSTAFIDNPRREAVLASIKLKSPMLDYSKVVGRADKEFESTGVILFDEGNKYLMYAIPKTINAEVTSTFSKTLTGWEEIEEGFKKTLEQPITKVNKYQVTALQMTVITQLRKDLHTLAQQMKITSMQQLQDIVGYLIMKMADVYDLQNNDYSLMAFFIRGPLGRLHFSCISQEVTKDTTETPDSDVLIDQACDSMARTLSLLISPPTQAAELAFGDLYGKDGSQAKSPQFVFQQNFQYSPEVFGISAEQFMVSGELNIIPDACFELLADVDFLTYFFESDIAYWRQIDKAHCAPELYATIVARRIEAFLQDSRLHDLPDGQRELINKIVTHNSGVYALSEEASSAVSKLLDEDRIKSIEFLCEKIKPLLSNSSREDENKKQEAKVVEAVALAWLYPTIFSLAKVTQIDSSEFDGFQYIADHATRLRETVQWMEGHPEIATNIHRYYSENIEGLQKKLNPENRAQMLRVFIPLCLSQLDNGTAIPRMFNNGALNLDRYILESKLKTWLDRIPERLQGADDPEDFMLELVKELLGIILDDVKALFPDISVFDSFTQNIIDLGDSAEKRRSQLVISLMQMQVIDLYDRVNNNPNWSNSFAQVVFQRVGSFLKTTPDSLRNNKDFYPALRENIRAVFDEKKQEILLSRFDMTVDSGYSTMTDIAVEGAVRTVFLNLNIRKQSINSNETESLLSDIENILALNLQEKVKTSFLISIISSAGADILILMDAFTQYIHESKHNIVNVLREFINQASETDKNPVFYFWAMGELLRHNASDEVLWKKLNPAQDFQPSSSSITIKVDLLPIQKLCSAINQHQEMPILLDVKKIIRQEIEKLWDSAEGKKEILEILDLNLGVHETLLLIGGIAKGKEDTKGRYSDATSGFLDKRWYSTQRSDEGLACFYQVKKKDIGVALTKYLQIVRRYEIEGIHIAHDTINIEHEYERQLLRQYSAEKDNSSAVPQAAVVGSESNDFSFVKKFKQWIAWSQKTGASLNRDDFASILGFPTEGDIKACNLVIEDSGFSTEAKKWLQTEFFVSKRDLKYEIQLVQRPRDAVINEGGGRHQDVRTYSAGWATLGSETDDVDSADSEVDSAAVVSATTPDSAGHIERDVYADQLKLAKCTAALEEDVEVKLKTKLGEVKNIVNLLELFSDNLFYIQSIGKSPESAELFAMFGRKARELCTSDDLKNLKKALQQFKSDYVTRFFRYTEPKGIREIIEIIDNQSYDTIQILFELKKIAVQKTKDWKAEYRGLGPRNSSTQAVYDKINDFFTFSNSDKAEEKAMSDLITSINQVAKSYGCGRVNDPEKRMVQAN